MRALFDAVNGLDLLDLKASSLLDQPGPLLMRALLDAVNGLGLLDLKASSLATSDHF
ncbi:MAG: hypothetical protein ABTQ32_26380 [Myxococcaceae bacterium]